MKHSGAIPLCNCLKQQIVRLSAVLSAALEHGAVLLQQNWKDGGNVKSTERTQAWV